MTKPMTTIIVDGLTWYSEDDWKVLVAENARLKAKLAWAMEGLPQMKADLEDSDYNSAYHVCKHILEQLTGGKDE